MQRRPPTVLRPHFPILDTQSFPLFFDEVLRGEGYDDSDTALCLVVLALGKLASDSLETGQSGAYIEGTGSGIAYFSPAYHILTTRWIMSFSTGTSLPTGLLLAAIYLGYLEFPLPAWKLVYMASTKLQLIVTQ